MDHPVYYYKCRHRVCNYVVFISVLCQTRNYGHVPLLQARAPTYFNLQRATLMLNIKFVFIIDRKQLDRTKQKK